MGGNCSEYVIAWHLHPCRCSFLLTRSVAEFYTMGFLTRLRMGDFAWRTLRAEADEGEEDESEQGKEWEEEEGTGRFQR